MATRQYIGARYVPKFYQNSVDGSTQWESNVVYEPLMYVTLTNGHMYISKKQVPATVGSPVNNIDYWLDIGSYNGFIEQLQNEIDDINDVKIPAINANVALKQNITDNNLTTTDKTVVGAINELDAGVDAINTTLALKQNATDNNLTTTDKTVVGAINELDADVNTLLKKVDKKIIFIGDSYQYGGGISGTGNRWASGWLGVLTNILGLTENVDFWHNEYPGYGFTTAPGFINLLQNLSPAPTDADAITDIIVTGGLNDTSGVNSLSTPIQTFISYCKTNYPNAKVHIGYLGNYWNNPQLRFDGRNVSVYYKQYANKFGGRFIENSQYLLHDANYYAADETWHPNQAGHNSIAYNMTNYVLGGNIEAISDYHGITATLSTEVFDEILGTVGLSAIVNNAITTIKSQNFIRFKSTNGVTIDNTGSYKLLDITACGINPAISGYSEVPVTVTFNNYVNGEFEYKTCACKIVYKNDNSENRGLYLETNYPYSLNAYSAWIGPFDMIIDTNLT